MAHSEQNLPETKQIVIDVVREAGDMLLSYLGRDIKSHSKGGVDFATEADLALDKFLRDSLKSKFPNSQFLTEETAPKDYSSLKTAEDLWVIDPIDGTTNFSRGIEPFCISVGLVSQGLPVLGVVYEPTKNAMYHASKDEEFAYLGDTDPLKVSNTNSLQEAYITTGLPWDEDARKQLYKAIENLYLDVRAMGMRGSSTQDLCEIAGGKIDGMFTRGIKPWDIAAGSLFVIKAGGRITKINGDSWNVFDPDLLFSNSLLHEDLLKALS